MASSKIDLIFSAVDKATSTMNRIENGLNNMQKRSSALGNVLNGALMGAGMAAFNAAIGLASSSIDGMVSKLTEAGARQTEAISNAGGLAVAINKPFSEASKVIDELNILVNKNLAALPGATDGYRALAGSIADNLVPAAKNLNGELNVDKLKNITLEMTKIYGLIGQAQNAGTSDITKGLSRALSGVASFSELENLMLFEGGVGGKVLEEIKRKTIAAGAKDLKDLSDQARIQIIQEAGAKFITEDMIGAYKKSFEGALENINTMLFDFTDFGAKIASRGGETVLDAAGKAINAVMELFSTISSTLGLTNPDILKEIVYDAFTLITNFTNGLNGFIQSLSSALSNSDSIFGDIGIITSKFGEVGFKTGEAIGQWLGTVDWASLIQNIGNLIVGMLAAIAGLVAGAIAGILPFVASGLNAIGQTINDGIAGILMSIGELVTGAFSTISTAISNFISNIGSQIANAINSIDLGSIISGLAASVKSKVQGLVGGGSSSYSGTIPAQPMAVPAYNYSMATIPQAISSNFAPNNYINVSGATGSPYDTAEAIVRALDKQWSLYRSSYNQIAI